ncbi:MAG: aminotransferase class I/II-fold pyridoxal phosphate-dependent enzyme [Phycisphaeraceae bacterium]|nr:aminotransferase class I/II-fold pyridoxal phosphate-dependent enzyme [Phycisphaeraceae bacterium]
MTTSAPAAPADARPIRADRLATLPPFLFDEIDRKKRQRIAAGADVINLGVGDPDQPTPEFIIDEMNRAMRSLVNQQYPAVGGGLPVFREAAAEFMLRRFGVRVDPSRHIVALLGSKDGIAHLPWAVTNPGDTVLLPDPAYPVYEIGAALAGCRTHKLPVSRQSRWLPSLTDAPPGRLLWLNYPSNPTAASANAAFYADALRWAAPRNAIVASDLAYSELYFSEPPPSLWQAPGADIESTRAIEFHSLSKTFNMTGWRIGFAVGHAQVVGALQEVKSNVDSGAFNAIQQAGALALRRFDDPVVAAMRDLYRRRRDIAAAGLRAAGFDLDTPDAGFFIWARCPGGDSMRTAADLLDRADVVVVPGAGFSPRAREYIRLSLTAPTDRIQEAVRRLGRLNG